MAVVAGCRVRWSVQPRDPGMTVAVSIGGRDALEDLAVGQLKSLRICWSVVRWSRRWTATRLRCCDDEEDRSGDSDGCRGAVAASAKNVRARGSAYPPPRPMRRPPGVASAERDNAATGAPGRQRDIAIPVGQRCRSTLARVRRFRAA